ncbi:MAG TPA: Gfo/Idh/MocA family oxidoreductase [Candidatus Angelobacter sp.]|nr:Gfo/Idh/MocA family oxidoreductase [Candidatus Angelobacter sp.]
MTTLLTESVATKIPAKKKPIRPRLGFLGVGWIGKNRLEAIAADGIAEITAIADASPGAAGQVARSFPKAAVSSGLEELLEADLDGIVIATPSALHAGQAVSAFESGMAVFCQKPLGRNAEETRRVVDAARASNRLLGVDLSYRFISAAQKVHQLCRSGELGDVFAIDLIFHNGYGPDKPWFYDAKLSGGGCVIDLGIHLVDLALWNLGFPRVTNVTGRLFAQGAPIQSRRDTVEDYALARLDLENGATVKLACSWKLPVGCDAVISAHFYGTKGAASFQNVNGSFYDFKAEHFLGTKREVLALPPENWGGCAAVDWARRLAADRSFSPEIETVIQVAHALDAIYDPATIKPQDISRTTFIHA